MFIIALFIRHTQDFCRGVCSMLLLGSEGLAGFVVPAVVRVVDSIGKKTMNEGYSHVSYIELVPPRYPAVGSKKVIRTDEYTPSLKVIAGDDLAQRHRPETSKWRYSIPTTLCTLTC